MSSDESGVWKAVKPFVRGAIAASAATTVVQPIDYVKVALQNAGDTGGSRNPIAVTRKVIAEEGVLALYRGLSAGLLRQLTYGTTRLGVFSTLTERYKPADGSPLPFAKRVAFSLVAGGVGALIGTPADAALVRMQSDSTLPAAERRNYKNGVDAMWRMLREEGVRGFFSGATPTVARGLSINVGMLSSYEPIKRRVEAAAGGSTEGTRLLSGALSGACAATMALPFDMIKTRMQRQKPDPATGKLPYPTITAAAVRIVQKEGITALYAGYPVFVVRIAPHIALTWYFIECLTRTKLFSK